jgi:hypothetical protein
MKSLKLKFALFILALNLTYVQAHQLESCLDREHLETSLIAQDYIRAQNKLQSIHQMIQLGHLSAAQFELTELQARLHQSAPQVYRSNCSAMQDWLDEHQKRLEIIQAQSLQARDKIKNAKELNLCQLMFEHARESYERVVEQFEKGAIDQDINFITLAIQFNGDALKRGECPEREKKRLHQMAENIWKVLPQYSARAPAQNN